MTTAGPNKDTIPLGAPELAVARGTSAYSCRTVTAGTAPTTGSRRCRPASDGSRCVVAQSLEPNEQTLDKLGLVMLIFGLAGVIAAALAGWGVARNGLRPVRRLTARRRGHRPHREARPDRRSRATTRSPGWPARSTRCSPRCRPPATGSASWSPTPATSCAPR